MGKMFASILGSICILLKIFFLGGGLETSLLLLRRFYGGGLSNLHFLFSQSSPDDMFIDFREVKVGREREKH